MNNRGFAFLVVPVIILVVWAGLLVHDLGQRHDCGGTYWQELKASVRLPKGCPCAGEKDCTCDAATGDYSFSDGCNTHECSANGLCSVTAMYCSYDWRSQ